MKTPKFKFANNKFPLKFSDLHPGDWFTDDDGYLVIKLDNQSGFNLAMNTGAPCSFLEDYGPNSVVEIVEKPESISF